MIFLNAYFNYIIKGVLGRSLPDNRVAQSKPSLCSQGHKEQALSKQIQA